MEARELIERYVLGERSYPRADLRWANLYRADLREANLRWANLHGAGLSGANLRETDLSGANLSGADLREANLHGADLREANLRWANLRGADLRGANLHWADLSGADLSGADLSGADLRGARYSPLDILQAAEWGELDDESLTVEMMRWDESCRVFGGPSFQVWTDGGECPYAGTELRAFRFQEKRDLYAPGPPTMSLAGIFVRLCEEKGIEIDDVEI